MIMVRINHPTAPFAMFKRDDGQVTISSFDSNKTWWHGIFFQPDQKYGDWAVEFVRGFKFSNDYILEIMVFPSPFCFS